MHHLTPPQARHRRIIALFWSLVLLTSTAGPTFAAPTDVFMSEYLEGSANNKAIELYNGTASAIDLGTGAYQLEFYFNGSATAGTTIGLTGTVAAGDVYVVADDNADAAVLAQADLISTLSFFSGDDAVVLRRGGSGGTVIDSLGQIGVDPGSEWSGSGIGTQDETLRRKSAVCVGDTNPSNSFNPATEWDSFAIDTFAGLGSHTATCSGGTPTVYEIFDIQGSGTASPYDGQVVSSLGNVVIAVGPVGFFMQTPDARADLDPDTSNGIYVFTGTAPGVSPGDVVDVTGLVDEFFEFTEITGSPTVGLVGTAALPTALLFDAATPTPDPTSPTCALEFECYEGMLIEIQDGTVGGANQRFGTDPIAEIFVVAGADRPFREPGVEFPGLAPPIPVWDGNPEVFELDPDRLGLPNQLIPAGSSFSATGALGFEFNGYELWPTALSVTPATLPVAVRPRNPNEMTVGSLNMFRFYDAIDDPGDDTVVSAAEYARRRAKFARYILDVLGAPDVLAVQEVEKVGVLTALAADITALNPSVSYSAYLEEGNDVGGIDVGFLVKSTVTVDGITQLGATEVLSVDGSLLHDRPPLLFEGRYTAGGSNFPLAVMVLHTRSLGGIDDPVDGPRVRQKRLEQAQSIAQKVQTVQTTVAHRTRPLVVIGDLNAFQFTDGYVDVVGQIRGQFDPSLNLLSGPDLVTPNLTNQVERLPGAAQYSFVFAGSAQVLDHALTSQSANSRVISLAYGRGNADAAVDLINDDTTPLRSSDHDGLVLYLNTNPRIFADGFAAGNTSAWSVTVP